MCFIAHAQLATPLSAIIGYRQPTAIASLVMKLLIAVALLVVGLSPHPGSGQGDGSGDGKWLAMKCMQKQALVIK